MPKRTSRNSIRGRPVAWQKFYSTARWQRLRWWQLRIEPLCKFCLERGRVTVATVVDHIEPHGGNWTAFCTGKLQSLCEQCHNSAKRQIELRGYCHDIDPLGYPIDPKHPFNRAR
jgi:5-methylcytosine-specific restriction endonuclease McrA